LAVLLHKHIMFIVLLIWYWFSFTVIQSQ